VAGTTLYNEGEWLKKWMTNMALLLDLLDFSVEFLMKELITLVANPIAKVLVTSPTF